MIEFAFLDASVPLAPSEKEKLVSLPPNAETVRKFVLLNRICLMLTITGRCRVNGPGHLYQTFDSTTFELVGNCSYVAVKHLSPSHSESEFEVRYTNEECSREGSTEYCTTEIDILTSLYKIQVARSREDASQALLFVNGERLPKNEVTSSILESTLLPDGSLK